jgi:cytochrome P450
LAEDPALQDELREHTDRIPNFIEETLRIESPTKTDCRLTRRAVTVGGVDIPAGTTVALLLGAANHDPRQFPSPDEFQADRPNARQHLAFGRGIHTCPGSPLARASGRISIERLLRRTRNIRLSEAHHGPASDRHFSYEPTWMLRSMEELHIEFDASPESEGTK